MEVVKVDSVTSRPCRRSDGPARRAWRLSGYRGPNDKGNRIWGPGGGFPSCPQYLLATGTVCALCSPVAPSMLGVLLLGTSARALSPATVVEFSSNRFNSQTSSFFCDIFLLFFFFFFFFCPPPKGLCFRSRSSTSNWSVDFAGIFSPEPSSP